MTRTFPTVGKIGAVIGLVLLFGCGGFALREWVLRDDHRALRSSATPLGLGRQVPNDLTAAASEQIAAIYDGVFHATVYYTPRESAFNLSAGFDMTPATKPGLKGKSFARDFLKAVELEGFGRMKAAVDGKWYVSCCRGIWNYAEVPLDSGGKPLRALRSTAVGADYQMVRSQASFRVKAEGIPTSFLQARWQVCDTGSGLKPGQIDFYWGEDAPMGPGPKLSRPLGMPHPIANPTVLVLR